MAVLALARPRHDREGLTLADGSELDLLGPAPGARESWHQTLVRDPALLQAHDVVGSRPAQSEPAPIVERAAKPRARAPRRRGRRRHRHLTFDPSDPTELLGDERGLPVVLSTEGGVLQVTPATPSRVRVATRRDDSPRARLEHFNGVAAIERRGPLDDGHANELAHQRVAHEHDLPVMGPAHAATRRGTLDANDLEVAVTGWRGHLGPAAQEEVDQHLGALARGGCLAFGLLEQRRQVEAQVTGLFFVGAQPLL